MPESGKTLLEIRHVTKAFPGTRALDNVSLDVRPGEILGLCGENGAGKSTLVKIISGVYPYGTYEGELFFRGEPLRLTGTRDSEAKGISIIHQELALVPQLTVAENIFLGGEPAAWGVIRQEAMNAAARRLLERVGLDVPPTVLVGSLGVGQRQMVEIAKALRRDVSLLILDEPTSALNETEVERLMETLRELRRRGVSCIYISHKLDELFEITDRITVLRDGQVVGTAVDRGPGRGSDHRHDGGPAPERAVPAQDPAPGPGPDAGPELVGEASREPRAVRGAGCLL